MKTIILLSVAALTTTTSAFAFPLSLPNESATRLALSGNPTNGYGITGYRNAATGQANTGHQVSEVVLNAPDPVEFGGETYHYYADYYITSLDRSPFSNPDGSGDKLAAAQATTPFNMTNLAGVISGGGSLSYDKITLSFGQIGADIQDSWNLGSDLINEDWTGNPASSVENRYYTTNSGNVEAILSYDGVEIITFGYSDLYEIIDYGATTNTGDDTISAFSDMAVASLIDGLGGDALNVGQAIIDDVNAGGGFVQLYFDTVQVASYIAAAEYDGGTGYAHANYSFSGSLMVVPEPSTYASLMGVLALAAAITRRHKK